MEKLVNLEYRVENYEIVPFSPPTLLHLATVKAAFNIWYSNDDDIENMLESQIEVQEKTSLMALPNSIKNYIAQKVETIASQLSKFRKLLPSNPSIENRWYSSFKYKIHWTSLCTINMRKTAKALVDTTDLNVEAKFQLAVRFCLEDQVNALSVQMPCDYLKENIDLYDNVAYLKGALIAKKHFKIPEMEHYYYHECFKEMLSLENEAGCHYYWQGFTEEEKHKLLRHSIRESYIDRLNDSSYILFIFIQFDKQTRLQLVQDDEYCSILLKQLLKTQFLHLFDECAKDLLKLLRKDWVVYLADQSVFKVRSTIAYKKKYVQICEMILQVISREFQITSLHAFSNDIMMKAMNDLMDEGEITIVTEFLNSVSNDWIKEWFYSYSFNLAHFVRAAIKHDIIECIIQYAFPTFEDRKRFLSGTVIDNIFFKIFLKQPFLDEIEKLQKEELDRLPYLLSSDIEEIKKFKVEFLEENGCNLCATFLEAGDWKGTKQFIEWCLESEEEVLLFYAKFFRSVDFGELFKPSDYLRVKPSDLPVIKPSEAICFLLKENNLGMQFNIELIRDACQVILSESCFYSHRTSWNGTQNLYNLLDAFLLCFIYEDPEALIDLKKKVFLDNDKKLYISLPFEFLDQINSHKDARMWRWNNSKEDKEEMYEKCKDEMVKDFFNWICSADERLKGQMEREFWEYFNSK